ncbi:hypothetical protein EDB84DRAFT_1611636 [Lactarius hengduanensis]|nr:hypothetical protein EDB84DRAFT_1611636 [Lactarius hengduanensis]
MDTQPRPRVPYFRFRVLIIGRANSGKTTILQRVCDTTGSPIIYRGERWRNERVTLDPSIDSPLNMNQRGEHTIDDDLTFSNNDSYVFHDSRGIESGSTEELSVLQEFIRRKCRETRLANRLHAIWFALSSVLHPNGQPTTTARPQIVEDICPDRNVPVIVVFTKYDQFRRNVQIHSEDVGSPDHNAFDAADKTFKEHYLRPLGDDIRFVRLEKMNRQNMGCNELIEMTATALNGDIVGLMILAVQRG